MKINLSKIAKIVNDSDQYIERKSNALFVELTRNYKILDKIAEKELLIEFYNYCILVEKSVIYLSKFKKYSNSQIQEVINQYNTIESRFFECLGNKIDVDQAKIGYSRYREKLESLLL